MNAFNTHAPAIKYKQNFEGTCVLSILASALFAANENVG